MPILLVHNAAAVGYKSGVSLTNTTSFANALQPLTVNNSMYKSQPFDRESLPSPALFRYLDGYGQ